MAEESFELFDKYEPESLEEAVQLAVGAASACWETLSGAGVFQSDRALAVSQQLCKWLENHSIHECNELSRMSQINRGFGEEVLVENDKLRRRNNALTDLLDNVTEQLNIERAAAVAMGSSWTPPPALPQHIAIAIQEFIVEYHKARAKHGEMTMDGTMTGDPATNDRLRFAALVEEVGEVAHELTYDTAPDDGPEERLMKELIQVANVALTWYGYLVPGPTVPGPQPTAEPLLDVTVASGPGWRIGGVVEAVGSGATVRVPDGYVGLMVPEEKLQIAIDAVLAS